ncbi:hypothetical protein Q3C01_15480 [Bradyrhizobium sp. UFLA05-109]
MNKSALLCVSLLALATPAFAGERTASKPTAEDCETRMQRLDASQAEGEERLAEKNEVIAFCTSQYRRDKTIGQLVAECEKYEEQPVVKQQFVAECQLAAFSYANALRALKTEYRK